MNGRMSKKLRRELRVKAKEQEVKVAYAFKEFINKESFKVRLKIAYKILIGRF